jgi:HK97 family phage portal protein
MSWITELGRLFVPQPMQSRESEFPAFEQQLAAIRRGQNTARPWRQAGVNEALGVPAILSAVSLISGTVGSLSMEAYRQGALVTDSGQIPRLIVRPNPRSTQREFWMKTAFYHATRGEFWWWVAHRDIDGNADALYPVPPWEIVVERNERDRQNPVIRWLNRVMPNADMRQQMYLPGPDGMRGVGPLQLAGAAVSVTVEASNWAANFFAGNLPSMIGTTDLDLDANDLATLDEQWVEKPGNVPRWVTSGMKIEPGPFDAQKAQLTESRSFQVGEVARMFSLPGPLLEYQMSGSSLTYRNEADIWTDFQRRCLSPHYLEPIEQEMSDLLTRSTVGRFNLEQLLRADTKTRYEVYEIGVQNSIMSPDEARIKEGLAPGSVDFAPVPFAPPQADPGPISFQSREVGPVRCSKCNWLLAEAANGYFKATCRKCKTVTELQPMHEDPMASALALMATREAQPITVSPAPVNVTIESGAIAAPDMSGIVQAISDLAMRDQPQPSQTTFAEGAFHSEIHVPEIVMPDPVPAEAPVVNVHTDSFVEAIDELKRLMAAPRTHTIIRDENHGIIGSKEEIA